MNILQGLRNKAKKTEELDLTQFSPADYRLPVWFFGFEGVFAGAFDLLKAFPDSWPALVVLGLANFAVSFTLMRRRTKLAKALWRGKETRKVAFGLLALRFGSHGLLHLVGITVTSPLAHVAFALAMAATTVGLLAYTQNVAVRALTAKPLTLAA